MREILDMSETSYTHKKNATLTAEIEVLDHCNKGGVPILFRQPHIRNGWAKHVATGAPF